jgi:hypothetical protein
MSTTTTTTPPATQSVGLQNLLSFIRAAAALAGSYFIGHAWFGHTVTADIWSVIIGAIVTIASTWWGIAAKTSNIEGIESAARSLIASLGGLAVSYGAITSSQLATALAAVIPFAVFIQSMLSKAKNQQIAAGTTVISATTNKAVSK